MKIQPKRLLVAHNVGLERAGGMSRLMGFIHDEVRKADWEVEFYSRESTPPGLGAYQSRFFFGYYVAQHVKALAAKGHIFQIVNIHEPCGWVYLKSRPANAPKTVVTSYGLEQKAWDEDLEEHRLGRKRMSSLGRLTRRWSTVVPANSALLQADHVICSNEQDRDRLISWGLRSEKITRMHSSASETHFLPSRDYARAETLVFAGTWRYQKGTRDLVAAFEQLLPIRPNLKLTVLGSGIPVNEVLASFSPAAQSHVRVLEKVSEQECAHEMARADIFVLPSIMEGTPLTMIEGMAGGLPIVTTDTCGMKDVIQHLRNGVLIPTRSPERLIEAIQMLADDRALRTRLGETARADAEKLYRWPVVAAPILAAYERLIEASPSRI